jgi:hypothetical protein
MAVTKNEQRTWGVVAYLMADQRDLSQEDAQELDDVATEEAKKLVRAARGLDDVYLSVHVDLTRTTGSLRYRVPGSLVPEPDREQRAGFDNLVSFIEEAKIEQPAKYHMLILWGHGSGPLGLFSDPEGGAEDQTGQLTLLDLHEVLRRTSHVYQKDPLDLLLVKSCYMATLEAATAIQTLVRYMICSQARVPLRTWTVWEEIFERLAGPPESVGPVVLQAIGRHYRDIAERNNRDEVPFSLLQPSGMAQLHEPLRMLFATMQDYISDPDIAAAIEHARPGVGGDQALVDVRRLCSNLMAVGYSELSARAAAVDAAITPMLVLDNTPSDSAFGGVGLFHFPRDPLLRIESFANQVTEELYLGLEFPNITGWSALALPRTAVTV